jgi:cellulose synthase A
LAPISSQKFVKKFGQSPIFIASTQLVDGETVKYGTLASQLTESIHVISCGYEEKTEWGKEVNKKLIKIK